MAPSSGYLGLNTGQLKILGLLQEVLKIVGSRAYLMMNVQEKDHNFGGVWPIEMTVSGCGNHWSHPPSPRNSKTLHRISESLNSLKRLI